MFIEGIGGVSCLGDDVSLLEERYASGVQVPGERGAQAGVWGRHGPCQVHPQVSHEVPREKADGGRFATSG